MGPRAVASRLPIKRTWFKPGTTLPGEGAHNISLSFLKGPSLLAFLLHARLQFLTCVIMPRKHKNKHHSRGKRHEVEGDTQEAQASAAAPGEKCLSSPSSVPQGSPRAPLLLAIARSFREPWPLSLVMQRLPEQDLIKVPRTPRRKVQMLPKQPWSLGAFAKIL